MVVLSFIQVHQFAILVYFGLLTPNSDTPPEENGSYHKINSL
jgi:hypothetical protein